MYKKIKSFIIIVIIFVFLCCYTNYKFYCIKNTVIDVDTDTKVTYTKKKEINSLLLNNKIFFDEFICELSKVDNIENCHLISIPFDNDIENVKFYGLRDNYKIDKNEKLYNDLEILSNKLNIYKIELSCSGEQKEMEVLFTQTWGINDTYMGLKYSKYNQVDLHDSHYWLAFTIKKGRTVAFEEPINSNSNWFYYCSRDLDICNYGFWYRVYDIVNSNLS